MSIISEYLPVLLPVVAVELILMLTALIHVLRHPHYRFGSKAVWIIVVVLVQIIGPILYFVFGKGEEE